MGAKAGLVYLGEGRPVDALKAATAPDEERSAALADTVLGDYVANAGTRDLGEDGLWPEPGTICAAAYDDFALIGYREIGPDRPSEITEWINAVSPSGGACGVFMHSVIDYGAFAIWEDGRVRRSISLAPDPGVMEDLGDRCQFETPFWSGDRAMEDGYPLPFHPLEFSEAALLAFFGFGIEGFPPEYEIAPHRYAIPAFRPAD